MTIITTAIYVARLTGIAIAAYLLALWLQPDGAPAPLLAPLTALLVIQFSIYQTIRQSLYRVLAVALGVLIAALLAQWLPFTGWTLALIIAVSLTLAKVLHLEDQLLEVPISAMLIFALGAHNSVTAADRLLETLVGAATGLTASLLLSSPKVRPALEAMQELVMRLSQITEDMAQGLRGEPTRADAERWLSRIREVSHRTTRTEERVEDAEDSVRLNPRARDVIDAGVALRDALQTMEYTMLALRGFTQALADSPLPDPAIRDKFADILADISAALTAYGHLVRDDLPRGSHVEEQERELDRLLRRATQDRDRLVATLRENPPDEEQWPLYGELRRHLDRLVGFLRTERRARARERWRKERTMRRHLPAPQAEAVRRAGTMLRNAGESAAIAGSPASAIAPILPAPESPETENPAN